MGTSASFARKISACLVAASLSLALVPASALAEDTGKDTVEVVASDLPDQSNAFANSSLGESQAVSAEQNTDLDRQMPSLSCIAETRDCN